MINDLGALIKLHQDEIFLNENELVDEHVSREGVFLRNHKFVLMRRQYIDDSVSQRVEHLNFMSMTLNIDVLSEGR